jgi:hypothetical protein
MRVVSLFFPLDYLFTVLLFFFPCRSLNLTNLKSFALMETPPMVWWKQILAGVYSDLRIVCNNKCLHKFFFKK